MKNRTKELEALQNELCHCSAEITKRTSFPSNVAVKVSYKINEILLLTDRENKKEVIDEEITSLIEYITGFRIPYNDKEYIEQSLYKCNRLLTAVR